MELVLLQLVFLVALLILTLLASLWPIFWVKVKLQRAQLTIDDLPEQLSKVISFGNCLACGAFIAICFLHLVPQTQEKWAVVLANSTSSFSTGGSQHNSFPIGSFIVLLSFSAVFFAEAFFLQRSAQFKHENAVPVIILTKTDSHENVAEESSSIEDGQGAFAKKYISFRDIEGASTQRLSGSADDLSCTGTTDYGALKARCSKMNPFHFKAAHCGHNGLSFCSGGVHSPKIVSFIFGVAFHYLLEGMTLGLQTNEAAAVSIFLAILMHGLFLASAVTVALLKSWLPRDISLKRMALCCGLLSLARPLGIVFGLAIAQATGLMALIAAATFQSTSAGIFIYITFMTLIPEEFTEKNAEGIPILWKIFAFTCGWSLLTLLSFVVM